MLIYFIKRLQRLFTTGIIDNIQKYFQYKRHQSSQYKEVEVDIQDAFQIFTLLFLGLLLSIGLLIFERIYHEKYKKKCKNIQTRQMKKIDEKKFKSCNYCHLSNCKCDDDNLFTHETDNARCCRYYKLTSNDRFENIKTLKRNLIKN